MSAIPADTLSVARLVTTAFSVVPARMRPNLCPVCREESWVLGEKDEMQCSGCGAIVRLGGLGFMKRPLKPKEEPAAPLVPMRPQREFE